MSEQEDRAEQINLNAPLFSANVRKIYLQKAQVAWDRYHKDSMAPRAGWSPYDLPADLRADMQFDAVLEGLDILSERVRLTGVPAAIEAATKPEPNPTDPKQAGQVLMTLCEWTGRGFGFEGPFKRQTEASGRQFGCHFTWQFGENPFTEEMTYGSTPYDALCQATTVMRVLLEESKL